MSKVDTRLTPSAYHEFVRTVDQLPEGSLEAEVAGWLSVGLSFAAEGIAGSNDSLASTTNGP